MSNQFENKQIWIVITPDETAEVLASFKYEHWAKDWRDKYSATSKVVEAMDSLPAQKGMKWVKASERLPNKQGRYHVKTKSGKDRTCIWYAGVKQFTTDVDVWLDESASSSNEDYVASDNNSSNTACDAPFKDNNSNQQ